MKFLLFLLLTHTPRNLTDESSASGLIMVEFFPYFTHLFASSLLLLITISLDLSGLTFIPLNLLKLSAISNCFSMSALHPPIQVVSSIYAILKISISILSDEEFSKSLFHTCFIVYPIPFSFLILLNKGS